MYISGSDDEEAPDVIPEDEGALDMELEALEQAAQAEKSARAEELASRITDLRHQHANHLIDNDSFAESMEPLLEEVQLLLGELKDEAVKEMLNTAFDLGSDKGE